MLGASLLWLGLTVAPSAAQTAGQGQATSGAKLLYWKQRNFRIPINLSPDHRDRVKEVILLASDDQGETWVPTSRTDPSHPAFSYRASHDGEFWFTVQTRTVDNKVSPSLDSHVAPRMKVVIDTEKPTLSLEPDSRRGSVARVRWEAKDRNLDLRSLILEYQVEGVGVWNRVPISNPKLIGARAWDAGTSEPLKVRMSVSDRAGNVAEVVTSLPDGTGDAPEAGPSPTETADQPPIDRLPDTGPPPPQIAAGPGFSPVDEEPPGQPAVATRREREPTPTSRTPGATGRRARPPAADWEPDPGLPPARPAPGARTRAPREPARAASAGAQDIFPSSNEPRPAEPNSAFAPGAANSPRAGRAAPPDATRGGAASAGSGALLVGSPRFKLQYAVDDAGPKGPATVELWVTRDGGRSWQHLSEDPDRASPIDVNLGGEGTFGISLVARSAAGLGDQPPVDGEPPRSWVEVDTTPPTVQLDPVQVGNGPNSGKVAITWRAADLHLAPRSVAIFWRADDPGASWQPLVEGQENSGRYIWTVPTTVPTRFHIRVEAVDSVGHRGYAETTDSGPVMVDRSRPRSRIIGLDTNARGTTASSDWPVR